MNRISLHIGALVLAIGAAGCFAPNTDDTGTSSPRGTAPSTVEVVPTANGGGSQDSIPIIVHASSTSEPGVEAMGPHPDPWNGRAAVGDNGGPHPDPWNQNGGDEDNNQGPRPNPNPMTK